MEVAAVAEPRLSPDVVSYSSVKDACAQTSETDRAELWFNLMVRAGVCPENVVSFNTVGKAHARNGNLKGAERWLQLAREQHVKLDVFSYNALIDAAARSSQPESAENWLLRMLQDGAQPDDVSHNSVINAWAKQGNASGAERIVRLMCEREVEPDVIRCCSSCLRQSRRSGESRGHLQLHSGRMAMLAPAALLVVTAVCMELFCRDTPTTKRFTVQTAGETTQPSR
jgi:pentatricopeptide repeat protein